MSKPQGPSSTFGKQQAPCLLCLCPGFRQFGGEAAKSRDWLLLFHLGLNLQLARSILLLRVLAIFGRLMGAHSVFFLGQRSESETASEVEGAAAHAVEAYGQAGVSVSQRNCCDRVLCRNSRIWSQLSSHACASASVGAVPAACGSVESTSAASAARACSSSVASRSYADVAAACCDATVV